MAKITVQLAPLRNPKWSATPLKPGAEVTLSVEAPKIKAGQHIEFRILYGTDLVDVVNGQDAQQTAKWTVPNLPHSPRLKFDALLHEKPSPKAGIHGVLGKVSSPLADVRGFALTITNIDACFVPHAEKIQVAYTVSDPGGAATSARIEVWGERYSTNQPLYRSDPFVPTNGAHNWNTWDGKANAGPLAGKYVTPEYSPYRLRIIAGVDQGSVDDPFAAGLKKVALAEKPFEVEFESIRIRLQTNLEATVQTALNDALGVEPDPPNFTSRFAATGRLPLKNETGPDRTGKGRIRIPSVRHNRIGESLNQGSSPNGDPVGADLCRVLDSYMDNNSAPLPVAPGSTKFAIDTPIYTRPELPVEIEARLRSRDPNVNKTPEFGKFDKEAIGPALFEINADDHYADNLYTALGTPANQAYFKNAAMHVKRGTHDHPYNDGANPVITYWQERFKITADGVRDVGDTQLEFVKGSNEITVFLNRTKLVLTEDYTEESNKKIKLKENLSKQDDVIWIVREPSGAAAPWAVTHWTAFPPGDNCREHCGGIAGKPPTDEMVVTLRKAFSGGPTGTEPIMGKGANAFPFTNWIDLDPDKVDAAKRERVESQAVTDGSAKQGLGGILFSPSMIAGDDYVLEAALRQCPYRRTLGCVSGRPTDTWVKGETGTMTVWRVATIAESWRMPQAGTGGLSAGVGEQDAVLNTRAHPGDGRNVNVLNINQIYALGFTEWLIVPPGGAGTEPHRNVNLGDANAADYRHYFNSKPAGQGFYNIPNAAAVNDKLIRWDHYRVRLPPNIPANRRRVVSLAIANAGTVPPGSRPSVAVTAAQNAITAWEAANGVGAADNPAPVTAIPISTRTPDEYKTWVKGECKKIANDYMDVLTPQQPNPRTQKMLRWPKLYEAVWNDGTDGAMTTSGLTLAGYCRGNGQALFFSVGGNADTFEHEMGHSLLLAHFAAASDTNFCWKHHDHGTPSCLMGYYNATFSVPMPAAAVGVPIVINTGNRGAPCSKCLLKLRGWNEEVLPCNWPHPDVF
jgi:hypothetical protein